MPRIVLGNTTVSIPPAHGDDWEIPFSAAQLLRDHDFDLSVHTEDGHVFEVPRHERFDDVQTFIDYVSERAVPGTLDDLLEHPLIAMTPDGRDDLSELGGLPDATILIGGFRVGELSYAYHDKANYRVSLGPDLLKVPTVIKSVLRNWQY